MGLVALKASEVSGGVEGAGALDVNFTVVTIVVWLVTMTSSPWLEEATTVAEEGCTVIVEVIVM